MVSRSLSALGVGSCMVLSMPSKIHPKISFHGGPDSFALYNQFLVGDGVFPVMACSSRWGEDLVNGMEEGSAVVAQYIGSLGLEEANVVVHIAFEKVLEFGEVLWVCDRWERSQHLWVRWGPSYASQRGGVAGMAGSWSTSAMSRPVSVAAQKNGGLDVHPICKAAGTTIMVSLGWDWDGSWGRT